MRFNNDMLYLGICALNSTKPDVDYIKSLDLDKLFVDCQRQKITALVCYALESVIELPKKWSEIKGKAIRKSLLFGAERDLITDFMNKNSIKYMLLKGIILENYYPKLGMREMSDNDIYYDIAFRDKLKDFMLSLGYTCTDKLDNHDIYTKEPIYNFEFHHRFFLKSTSKALHNYYRDIEKRMLKDNDNGFSYHLSDEDLYIYLIAHEYKHYSHNGTGLRSLFDCIVFLREFEDTMDWSYIRCEIDKIGIGDFEETQRKLCKKLSPSFLNEEFTQEEVAFLEYLLSSGVYGNVSTEVLNKARGKVDSDTKITFLMKVKYIFRRLFPPLEFYKRWYPFFYKHKYLIPFCFLYRLYLAVFKRAGNINKELKILNKKNK